MFVKSYCVLVVLFFHAHTVSGQGLLKFRPSSPANRPEAPMREPSAELRLSDFRPVAGTTFLMASLDEALPSRGSALSSSSSFESVATRNHVFFDLTSDQATSLLRNNESLILSLRSLSFGTASGTQELETPRRVKLTTAVESGPHANPDKGAVLWHAVVFVTTDTDGDGRLTPKDNHALGIADAGGRDFEKVIPNLGHVFSETMLDSETLHIIHGDQTKQVAARIDLPTRKVTSSNPLPDFGLFESEMNRQHRLER